MAKVGQTVVLSLFLAVNIISNIFTVAIIGEPSSKFGIINSSSTSPFKLKLIFELHKTEGGREKALFSIRQNYATIDIL